MTARKKRKPDFRRIRPSHTYSITELAKAAECTPATVRRWLREGMPVLDRQRPPIIDGEDAKAWLKKKWAERKTPTGPREAFCLRCRQPRLFADGLRTIEPNTNKVLTISGKCAVCGGRMNKFASAASIAVLDVGNERKCDGNAA